eukprot:CAMPEP_0113319464 /NCGR_PEP_ID=MMETSP0010_2-20120614/13641_1 /TAXON_ID=216773 ORGANISM="Corethron hystrix, Strain 308" /NCGR_SAMPLE_ID=MMETSP0010_2 /ASSEMBLY_ACC=CAM_ASM_000155 /LENGTH=37 /DNA_ID=CAMNT_0000177009 /DNA_START=299 /DNA_END=412 /DNA_ORIENTATION=- /assembly_acc=CAM_ASM_000155
MVLLCDHGMLNGPVAATDDAKLWNEDFGPMNIEAGML